MKVVLHICCGVCAAGVVERLKSEGYDVLGLFYNPNIHPPEEYARRLDAARYVASELHFRMEESPCNPDEWVSKAGHLASEPEGGKRCEICYRLRLEKTFYFMKDNAFDAFTTTLTTSPHKPATLINQIGREIGGDLFLARDFKKKDGFKGSTELSRKWNIYHQNYCGCAYSIRHL